MAWRVDGPEGRHFEHDGTNWTGDLETRIDMAPHLGNPVIVTPTGPVYDPTSKDDPVGLYLLAKQIVPGPHRYSGDLPAVGEYEAPEGAVF